MEPIILIIIGVLDVMFTSMMLRRRGFVEDYVTISPKAYIWRKLFGAEKAIKLIKSFFAPLGLLLGIVILILGIFLL